MAGAALLLAAVPAYAQDSHGVIAFGGTAGRDAVAYGAAWNRDTRDKARMDPRRNQTGTRTIRQIHKARPTKKTISGFVHKKKIEKRTLKS